MFVESAYIRIESDEVREKVLKGLEDIGYQFAYSLSRMYCPGLITSRNGYVFNVNSNHSPFVEAFGEYVYCGSNVDLFLAIVALRDDSMCGQWLIDPCGYWHFDPADTTDLRVATVEELKKHFNHE